MNNGILTSGYTPPQMPRGLLGRPTPFGAIDPYAYDADAMQYISAVEAADGQRLEVGVRVAVNAFVTGCKADGIWDLISDCCILCGARTLSGALVPIKGATPTNFNFVSGDYQRGGRTPGLRGNGTSKYLFTNRRDSFFNPNNVHCSVFVTEIGTVSSVGQYIGASNVLALLYINSLKILARAFFSAGASAADLRATGLIACSRVQPQAYLARGSGRYETVIVSAPLGPSNTTIAVLARNGPVEGNIDIYSNGRCAFYSLGAGVDLMVLERRVSDLIAEIRTALS